MDEKKKDTFALVIDDDLLDDLQVLAGAFCVPVPAVAYTLLAQQAHTLVYMLCVMPDLLDCEEVVL